ncbi:hypothetical protein SAMN04487910_4330 [Aquimarina amphilecti]|uniref:Uncharacterized protein n=1 Tax=Aquimarina amphilecti TaxID=1038014 RepID=A0A1H7W9V4_AQUAM|nr:hypothetical protein [Aquimarina amphilecti]SEM17707.1 hypothetical protein SAMN04487910_4330 [Aquimarina amphilecti]
MKISDLIDEKISKIRFNYTLENEHGMQEFQSQIRLSNGQVVLLPKHPDDDIDLVEDYSNNKNTPFEKAQRYGLTSRLMFRNKQIKDIHFRFSDNEQVIDSSAILELDNGKFITENNYGPNGLTDINLVIMNKTQFLELADDNMEIKSLRKDILKRV